MPTTRLLSLLASAVLLSGCQGNSTANNDPPGSSQASPSQEEQSSAPEKDLFDPTSYTQALADLQTLESGPLAHSPREKSWYLENQGYSKPVAQAVSDALKNDQIQIAIDRARTLKSVYPEITDEEMERALLKHSFNDMDVVNYALWQIPFNNEAEAEQFFASRDYLTEPGGDSQAVLSNGEESSAPAGGPEENEGQSSAQYQMTEQAPADYSQKALNLASIYVLNKFVSEPMLKAMLENHAEFSESDIQYALEICQPDWLNNAIDTLRYCIDYGPLESTDTPGMLEKLNYLGFSADIAREAIKNLGTKGVSGWLDAGQAWQNESGSELQQELYSPVTASQALPSLKQASFAKLFSLNEDEKIALEDPFNLEKTNALVIELFNKESLSRVDLEQRLSEQGICDITAWIAANNLKADWTSSASNLAVKYKEAFPLASENEIRSALHDHSFSGDEINEALNQHPDYQDPEANIEWSNTRTF